MNDISKSPDAVAVSQILYDLASKLKEQDIEGATTLVVKLATDSKADFTTDLIAPCLFLGTSSESLNMSHQDALTLLTFLATIDPTTFLKQASRSVKQVTERLMCATSPDVIVSDHLLQVLVAQLCGNDVEVASNATIALTAFGRRPPLAERVIPAIVIVWQNAWDQTDSTNRTLATTVCVRCASAVVGLVNLADESMEVASKSGALDLLLLMMADEPDPLLQMSVLDLIEVLATGIPMHGNRSRWLFSCAVIEPLLQMAGGADAIEYPDPILGGPALRLLATLCRLNQRDTSLFGDSGTALVTAFHRALRNFEGGSGELDRLALVDAISSFASASPEALEGILNDPMTRDAWLSLAVAQPKLKSVILYSIAMVMDPPFEQTTSGDAVMNVNVPSNALTLRLFSFIGHTNGGDATHIVLTAAKSPFIEARLGAFALLAAFAKRGTGAQVLLSSLGFYDFLISREGETTKEGKEAKFAIIEAVMGSDARRLLADKIVTTLDKMLHEGPHFVPSLRFEVHTE